MVMVFQHVLNTTIFEKEGPYFVGVSVSCSTFFVNRCFAFCCCYAKE